MNEQEYLKPFSIFFKAPTLKKTLDRFAIFDYIDEPNKKAIELKSRYVSKDAYEETMIGYNKIKEGERLKKLGYKVYYVFSYSDGVYYCRHSKKLKYRVILGGWRKNGVLEQKKQALINTNQLKKVGNIIKTA